MNFARQAIIIIGEIMKKLLTICLCTFSVLSHAYSSERAIANLSSDYATCAAYYLFMAKGLEASDSDSSQLTRMGILAFEGAVMLSNKKVTKSRVKLSYQQFVEETGSNFSNSAILIEKYGLICKSVLENPETRLNYWLNKK